MKQPTWTRTLDVKALDNRGRTHTVDLFTSVERTPKLRERLILRLNGTPGSWYLQTLLLGWPPSSRASVPTRMSIDMGAGWEWVNVAEVLADI